MISEVMNPRERVMHTLAGKKPDKLPIVVINSNTFMCMYYHISVEDYVTKPDTCAEVHIEFIREFEIDYDNVATGYILYGAGPELGVKWEFAGDNFPGNIEGPIKTEADLDQFKLPTEPSGYFKNYIDTIKIVHETVGDEYYLTANIIGPFTVGCFLRGIEQTLMDTVMDPDFFQKLMQLSTEISVFLGNNVLSTGLKTPILNEIFLTPGMISPDDYHSHIAPYDLEVQRRLGPERTPLAFAFMGKPSDPESQKISVSLNNAFFGVGESIAAIKDASRGERPAGFPFPVGISGRSLATWDTDRILSFLKQGLDYLVYEKGCYPCIILSSVQADSQVQAAEIATKINAIRAFRDGYRL
jgi:hypothetical protein